MRSHGLRRGNPSEHRAWIVFRDPSHLIVIAYEGTCLTSNFAGRSFKAFPCHSILTPLLSCLIWIALERLSTFPCTLLLFFLQPLVLVGGLAETLLQPLRLNYALAPLFLDLLRVLLDLFLLLLQHDLLLRVQIDFLLETGTFVLELAYALFDSFQICVKYFDFLPLVNFLLFAARLDGSNLLLPITSLPQRALDSQILSLDLLAGLPDHVFDEELAIAQLADSAPLGLLRFRADSRRFRVRIERSCLLHAVFAIGNAAEITVRVMEVGGLDPGGLAGVAAIVCIAEFRGGHWRLPPKYAILFVELELALANKELSAALHDAVHTVII